ncbi:MAG: isoprenylcysteine carboxylmethyltransferase family protein [Pyrinomonadaceae bacterium]|nr:isoprenylcysteine carboxylmethyltransferase family protein [Pyrinomonadaceae bacterium]
MFARTAAFLYGLVCYLIFLVTFLYAIGFVGNLVVPKSIDSGPGVPLIEALLINTLLLSLFAIQHSVMARQWFKRAWTKIIPQPLERSTFVLLASLVLALLFWQWRPMQAVIWDVQNPTGRIVLQALFWMGWGGVLFSTYLIDHFSLFGLRQVYLYLKGLPDEPTSFKTPALYRVVRHPLYLGFVVAFWSAPRMTLGHLFFAAVCTAYIVLAIQFEERDLMEFYGDRYRKYRTQVSMLLPLRFGKK